MYPSFVSNDYLQSRLALPFGKPLLKPFPFNKPVLQPMPNLDDLPTVKGYFLGGLIPRGGTLEEFAARNPTPKSIGQRINDFGNDNTELLSALLNIYRK
jgi:hypothetical protein